MTGEHSKQKDCHKRAVGHHERTISTSVLESGVRVLQVWLTKGKCFDIALSAKARILSTSNTLDESARVDDREVSLLL